MRFPMSSCADLHMSAQSDAGIGASRGERRARRRQARRSSLP